MTMLSCFAFSANAQVAKIGNTEYATLQAAINAATAGRTITLIGDVNESVTVSKNLTIDGGDNNYTGTMNLSNSDVVIENVNFLGGTIVKGKNTSFAGVTIKNCDFSNNGNVVAGYAIDLRSTNAVVIENCVARDYYAFLQVPSSNTSLAVKNVEIEAVYYGFKIDYSNSVSLENVKVKITGTSGAYGIYDSNYGDKTYTIKNCEFDATVPLKIWEREAKKTTTFKFEGVNVVPALPTSNYAIVDAAAQNGTKLYGNFSDAAAAAKSGETIVLLKDYTGEAIELPKGVKLEANGFKDDNIVSDARTSETGTWGGIDWTLYDDGELVIAPTAGEPVADKNAPTKRTYKVGEWREAVVYKSNGSASAIGGWPYDRSKVTKLTIEEGVTKIGSFTVQDYTKLKGEVIIPSTVTYIGQEAFKGSTFETLTFAEGGTEELCIAHGAFKNLVIEEVALPADRPKMHIHAWLFNNCHNLKYATLPANITSMHGTNHREYEDGFEVHANPTWTKSSEIFAYNENMKTITFGSEEVKNIFFAIDNGTSKDYTVATVGLVAYCDLQDAINAAKAGDVINILKNNKNVPAEAIVVDKAVTINGNGKTFTSNAEDCAFKVTAQGAKIENLKISAPNAVVDILTEGATLVKLADSYYPTVAAAVDAAEENAELTLLAGTYSEDINIKKSVTLKGATSEVATFAAGTQNSNAVTYTGKMVIGNVTATVENVDFVKGCIDANESGQARKLTIKNCNFDGVDNSIGYAITQRHGESIVIENCTAKNYSTGMLYIPLNVTGITVKNVAVANVAAAFNIQYSGNGLFEDVTISEAAYGLHVGNYGARTFTLKNCEAKIDNPIYIQNKGTATVTFAFEGNNDFAANNFALKGYGVLKLAEGATVKAADGLTFTHAMGEDYEVKYNNGSYSVVEKANDVAKIGETGYESLAAAFAAANIEGDHTITLLADNAEKFEFAQVAGANITVDGNGKTFAGKIILNGGAGNLKFTNATLTPYYEKNDNGKDTWYSIVLNASTAPNVTIDGCIMKNTGTNGAIVWGQASTTKNEVVIKNSTASNLQYLVGTNQAGANNVTVENVTATNMAYLIRPMKAAAVTVKDVTYSGLTFVQVKNSNPCTLAIENVTVTTTQAGMPPITMLAPDNGTASVKYTITLKGENIANGAEMTTANEAAWFATASNGLIYEIINLDGLNGKGTEAEPFLINNVNDLEKFRNSVNAGETKYNAEGVYVALAADIDLANTDWSVNIGDDCNATFDGIFDGQNYTIYNLTSIETAQKGDGYICTGLFGAIGGKAVVKNFTINNVTIETGEFTGNNAAAVVGFAYNATGSVENVTVTGDININASKVVGTGVIVGYSYGGNLTVDGCVVSANANSVVNGQAYVGGIIGYATKATLSNNTVENIDINATSCAAAGIAGIMNNGGTATDNTVKNVNLVSTHENWKNAAAIVVGTITSPVTISGTVAKDVTANGVATTSIAGAVFADKPTTPVAKVAAKIGDVYYKTLADALAAEGNEVTLLAPITVAAGETVVLDLNGKTIVGRPAVAGAYAVITNYGDLTIKNGSVVCDNTLAASTSYAVNTIVNSGALTVENATIENKNAEGNQIGYAIDNNSTSYDATVVIAEGAEIKVSGSGYYDGIRLFCNSLTAENNVVVNGGEVSSIWLQNPSDGATEKNTKDVKGSVAINGGKVGALYLEPSTAFAAAVTGGEVGSVSYFQTAEGRDLTGFITGGTFNSDVAAFVAAGYVCAQAEDGSYSVAADPAYGKVAKIGDVYYETFVDAYVAAKNGDVITLIADVTIPDVTDSKINYNYETAMFEIRKAITIDGNGHTMKADAANTVKKHTLHICTNGVVLKNVVIDNVGKTKNVNVYCAQNVVFDNVQIANAKAGSAALTVNNSTVTTKTALTISGTVTAIDIDYGKNIEQKTLGLFVEEGTVFNLNNKTVKFNSAADVTTAGNAVDTNGNPYFVAKDNAYLYTVAQMKSRLTGYSNGLTFIADAALDFNLKVKGTLDLNGHNVTIADGKSLTASGKLTIKGNGLLDVKTINKSLYTITIEGGTYTIDVTGYCAEGYAALQNLDGNYVVGTKPTAQVNNLGELVVPVSDYIVYGGSKNGDMPLSFVMQFLANQTAQDMATSPYADWFADFVITFDGLEGDFVADGCYLAGYYGEFGWVKVPVDGMTVKNGERYPVMLGVNLGQKYDYICNDVKDFRCAMFLTPEVIAANPNISVKLELAVVDNSKASEGALEALVNNEKVYTVGEYTYTAEDFKSPVVDKGTWGGIDWTLTYDGTLTIAPTTGTPTTDNSGKWTYEVGQWPEAVRYNSKGVAAEIALWPYDCTKVKTLIIKEGVTSIGSFTARSFTNLTGEVVIPSTVTYIGQEAFQFSTMTKVTFAEGGTEPLCIAQGAFKNLVIEEIALPADRPSVHLHAWVFQNCHYLKNVTLPANVTGITGTNHVDYNHNANEQTGGNAGSSAIFADTKALETITFGSDEVKNLYFSKERGNECIVATVGLTSYSNLATATEVVNENGGTITMNNNATLANTWTIPAGKEVTLDLNGKTLSQSKACTASYEMINNKGNLTITGNGKISFTDTSAGDPNFKWGSYTVRNEGNLVVENGTIEHKGAQAFGTHCIMALYQYSGYTTINGGTISTPNYRSVRLWKGDMTIKGGTFDGQVWVQAVDNSANLTIKGGTFAPSTKGDASSVFVENKTYDVAFAVANGTFETKIGVANPEALAGCVTGGKFSEAAKNATNTALLAEGYVFGELVDGYCEVVEVNYVAQVGEKKYASLQAAINAATKGATVTLLADITEDVTLSKSVTIDGAEKTYTGKMTVKADATIKNVNFDGKGYDGYAVETRGANYLTVEDCTAKNYGYGLVQTASGTVLTTVKNVTISDMRYGIKVDYSNAVVLDNVTMTNVNSGILNSNYGEKTITIKNSVITTIAIWERNQTINTTFKFEGENTVATLATSSYAKYVLDKDATLTAPENDNVASFSDDYMLLYENGTYRLEALVIDELIIVHEKYLNYENKYVKQVGKLTYTREIYPEDVCGAADDNYSAQKWVSFCLPFRIPVSALNPDKYEVAYLNNVLSYDDNADGKIDRMRMEYIKVTSGTLHANTPYMIRVKESATTEDVLPNGNVLLKIELNDVELCKTSELKSINMASSIVECTFAGLYDYKTSDELKSAEAAAGVTAKFYQSYNGNWVSGGSNGLEFYPFEAYLKIVAKEGSPIEFDEQALKTIGGYAVGEEYDGTTYIYEVVSEDANDGIYDLSGRRVNATEKGVYIVNGKKVLVK